MCILKKHSPVKHYTVTAECAENLSILWSVITFLIFWSGNILKARHKANFISEFQKLSNLFCLRSSKMQIKNRIILTLALTTCTCTTCDWRRNVWCGKFFGEIILWWLGSRVVSMLDSGAEGPGFKSQSQHCRVTVLGKLFTPIAPLFTKQQNW